MSKSERNPKVDRLISDVAEITGLSFEEAEKRLKNIYEKMVIKHKDMSTKEIFESLNKEIIMLYEKNHYIIPTNLRALLYQLNDEQTQEWKEEFHKILKESFEPLKFKTMEPQNTSTKEERKEKEADKILSELEETIDFLLHVKSSLNEFTDALYPEEIDKAKEAESDKKEPSSFEEKVKDYLKRQKAIINDLQDTVNHLRTFI